MLEIAKSLKEFKFDVEGIGTFVCKDGTSMAVTNAVHRARSRIIGGVAPSSEFEVIASVQALFEVLIVTVPDGWSLDNVDALTTEGITLYYLIWDKYRDARTFFRTGGDKGREG